MPCRHCVACFFSSAARAGRFAARWVAEGPAPAYACRFPPRVALQPQPRRGASALWRARQRGRRTESRRGGARRRGRSRSRSPPPRSGGPRVVLFAPADPFRQSAIEFVREVAYGGCTTPSRLAARPL